MKHNKDRYFNLFLSLRCNFKLIVCTPIILVETLDGHCKLTLKIIIHKQEQSASDGASTLGSKVMGRVNKSPKKKTLRVAPHNVDLSLQKVKTHKTSIFFKK